MNIIGIGHLPLSNRSQWKTRRQVITYNTEEQKFKKTTQFRNISMLFPEYIVQRWGRDKERQESVISLLRVQNKKEQLPTLIITNRSVKYYVIHVTFN